MSNLSYNESSSRSLHLRHLFLPGAYGMVSEAVIGVLALIVFHLSELNQRFLGQVTYKNNDPLSLWGNVIHKLLNSFQSDHLVQRVLIFVLWALIGALVYILAFQLLQFAISAERSIGTGVRMTREYRSAGLLSWLASLHDFFLKLVIAVVALAIFLCGAVVCFGIASQELSQSLAADFPSSLGYGAISIIGAVLSVRLIVLGLSLAFARFRNWYTA